MGGVSQHGDSINGSRTERPFYLESRETEYIAKLAIWDVRTSAEEEGSE